MGIFKIISKLFFFITLVSFIIIGIIIYYGNGLQNASIDKFEINTLNDSSNNMIIETKIHINNPSKLSLNIKSLKYNISLKENNQVIGNSDIPEFTISKNNISKLRFETVINWMPSQEFMIENKDKEEILIVINGKTKINLFDLTEYEIPFSKEMDIKDSIDSKIKSIN
ncbi:LEA type 2 family protein [Candidatus Woesearchaeota archaeon]|jgi:hypothetical protein|nr:LEA type 2 family protein [Candidatus Woesearchaeota archaeon]MBT4387917.1 LEA type 2 family protein [Candidatus Woesearchaeota archaeon]MBT4595735.1 LEA type 2 family protein [Candidatus Woesearchaeota archaeon]MBT5741416.1 LEA type 2 family protein [Candidatus Woesearchaeota archaeon]MBT7296127.1 LEA type 2 family protein [Candidatus Woesearchaeota archaeon]